MEPKRTIEGWLAHALENGQRRVGRRRFADDLDRVRTIEEEQKSLFDFCRWRGIAPASFVAQRLEPSFALLPKVPRLQKGTEHEVFYYEENGCKRVIKITFPDKFGRQEHTPFLYLERLSLLNEMMPALDIRFEDFIAAGTGFSFVTTMRFFSGPHPDGNRVATHLEELGFHPHRDASTTLDFIHPGHGLLLRDCHPQNWIELEDGNLIPIDVIPELIV